MMKNQSIQSKVLSDPFSTSGSEVFFPELTWG